MKIFPSIFALALALNATCPAASSIRTEAGFYSNSLAAGDSVSSRAVSMGLDVTFLGATYNALFVNTDGSVTFNSPLGTAGFTNLTEDGIPMIAPFYADVDTSGAGLVSYGMSSLGGRNAFAVDWIGVGYFFGNTSPTNSFQLVLIDRMDIASGDFDIEFNYDHIGWESGDSAGGNDGLGGNSAIAGYSNGGGIEFNLSGSKLNGAFLDGGPDSLAKAGRFSFEVRSGEVRLLPPGTDSGPDPVPVPEGGSTLISLALALSALGLFSLKLRPAPRPVRIPADR